MRQSINLDAVRSLSKVIDIDLTKSIHTVCDDAIDNDIVYYHDIVLAA